MLNVHNKYSMNPVIVGLVLFVCFPMAKNSHASISKREDLLEGYTGSIM